MVHYCEEVLSWQKDQTHRDRGDYPEPDGLFQQLKFVWANNSRMDQGRWDDQWKTYGSKQNCVGMLFSLI